MGTPGGAVLGLGFTGSPARVTSAVMVFCLLSSCEQMPTVDAGHDTKQAPIFEIKAVKVVGISGCTFIDAGGGLIPSWGATCAICSGGALWCWGGNGYGQLGDGTRTNRSTPVRVGARVGIKDTWKTVSTSGGHTCAIHGDGSLWCWGDNMYGQLGDGTGITRISPVKVADKSWKEVSAGEHRTCAVRKDGTLWCWSLDKTKRPVQIGSATTWRSVSYSFARTYAIQENGMLWGWGTGGYLGDGTTTDRSSPVKIGIGQTWRLVHAAPYHTFAIKTDGTLWGWGASSHGQLMRIKRDLSLSPFQIYHTSTWRSLSGVWHHSCGTRADRTLWCWGFYVGLYLGSPGDVAPTRMGTRSDWEMVSTGDYHTCALKTDGSVWCWGNNTFGQLGDGTAL